MPFFEHAHNFTIGNASEYISSGAMNLNIDNRRSETLHPPSYHAATHIQTQFNGPSSAPALSSGHSLVPESSPPIPASQSAPEVSSACSEEQPEPSAARSPVKAEPSGDPLASQVPPFGGPSMPSPPPSPKTPAPPTPRIESAHPRNTPQVPASPSSSGHSPIQHRPRPSPLQPETTFLNPLRPQTTLTEGSIQTNQSGPTFTHGIVAAISAQAHLLQKTKQIGDLLDKFGIRSDDWVGQVGFRLDSPSEGRGAELPSILRQEIVITISDRGSAKARLSEISEGLKALVTPHYGAIRFRNSKKTLDLGSQKKGELEASSAKDILSDKCSRAHKSMFEFDLPDPLEAEKPPVVKLNVTNFADDENPQNHFTTSLRFTLEKDEKANEGSNTSKVSFSELRFEGPVPYSMRGACVRVELDQPSVFEDVIPEEQYEVDPTSQYKHSTQKTHKTHKTKEVQLKIGRATEGTLKAGRMDGEEDMNGVETMRNSWLIRHSDDRQSKTLRYVSMRPEVVRQMSFPKAFRPSMKFAPNSRRSPPSTLTIRIWSFWTLESQSGKTKGGLFQKIRTALKGKSGSLGFKADPRMHTNVGHCMEIVVPLDFVGHASEFVTREDILEEL